MHIMCRSHNINKKEDSSMAMHMKVNDSYCSIKLNDSSSMIVNDSYCSTSFNTGPTTAAPGDDTVYEECM